MDQGVLAVLFAVGSFASLTTGSWAVSHFGDKKRRVALRAFADAHGFAYAEADSALQALPFKRLGHVTNVVRGQRDGVEFTLFDLQYTRRTSKRTYTVRRTACLVQHGARRVPRFFARPRDRFGDAIGRLFGGQDVRFPEDRPFVSAYVLQTIDHDKELRYFRRSHVRAALVAAKRERPTIESVDKQMLLSASRIPVDRIDAFITTAVELRESMAAAPRRERRPGR